MISANRITLHGRSKITRVDYFLVAWILLLSGSPSIREISGATYLTAIFAIIYIIGNREFQFLKIILPSTAMFTLVFLGQYLTLNFLPIKYPLGILVTIIAGSFAFYKLGENFRYVYFNVIYFFCAVSLFFWTMLIVTNISLDFFGIKDVRNIVVWSVRSDPYNLKVLDVRNNGPFWEPGAFAGYILVLFFLFFNDLQYLWKNRKKQVVIILAALLSTFSTAGYFILIFVFLYKFLRKNAGSILGFICIPPVIFAAYLFVLNTDFIGKKISAEYNNAYAASQANIFTNTRFGVLYYDFNYISKNPIFGNGIDPKTRWADDMEILNRLSRGENIGHGNGFSGYIAAMGLAAMCFILVSLYFSFRKRYEVVDSIFLVVVFILILQGESFLNYPLYLCLYFVNLTNKNERPKILNNYSLV